MHFMLKNSFLSPHRQQIFRLLGNKKRGLASYSELEKKQTLFDLRCSSDDFSDGMNDTEQQPDEEGESSDETAYD